ncbi:MAG: HEAT repeat domain-containing protein [Phycisphaerae bacterium]|nr:HEAT repeat domain-containing protein [Phycisphaerae bacterium]
MDKDFLLLGLFGLLTSGAIGGTVAAWWLPSRLARALGTVALTVIYLVATFLIVNVSTEGGCMHGFIVVLVAVPLSALTAVGMLISAIIAGFTTAAPVSRGRRLRRQLAMGSCIFLLLCILVGIALNQPIRAMWYERGLGDRDASVRAAAADKLGEIGHGSAIPALCAALHDADATVRQRAAFALLMIEARSAVPALRQALTDPSPEVRSTATTALGVLGGTAIAPDLIGMLDDESPAVRKAAVQSLDALDPRWRERPGTPRTIGARAAPSTRSTTIPVR